MAVQLACAKFPAQGHAAHAGHFYAEQEDINLNCCGQREGLFAGLRLKYFVSLRRQNLPQSGPGGGVIVGDEDGALHTYALDELFYRQVLGNSSSISAPVGGTPEFPGQAAAWSLYC